MWPGTPVSDAEVGVAELCDRGLRSVQLNPAMVAATVGEEHQLTHGAADLHLQVTADDASAATVARVEHHAHPGAPECETCETAECLPQMILQPARQVPRSPVGLGSANVLVMDEELVGVDEAVQGIEPQGREGRWTLADRLHQRRPFSLRVLPPDPLAVCRGERHEDPRSRVRPTLADGQVRGQIACCPALTECRGIGSYVEEEIAQRVAFGSCVVGGHGPKSASFEPVVKGCPRIVQARVTSTRTSVEPGSATTVR